MRSRRLASIALSGSILLSGCSSTAPAELSAPEAPPILDRARTDADDLPGGEDAWSALEPGTSRYVGKDDSGNRYWVARAANADEPTASCIAYVPPADADRFAFCGGVGLTGTTNDGLIVEFASAPQTLSVDDAELIGDTLLVLPPN